MRLLLVSNNYDIVGFGGFVVGRKWGVFRAKDIQSTARGARQVAVALQTGMIINTFCFLLSMKRADFFMLILLLSQICLTAAQSKPAPSSSSSSSSSNSTIPNTTIPKHQLPYSSVSASFARQMHAQTVNPLRETALKMQADGLLPSVGLAKCQSIDELRASLTTKTTTTTEKSQHQSARSTSPVSSSASSSSICASGRMLGCVGVSHFDYFYHDNFHTVTFEGDPIAWQEYAFFLYIHIPPAIGRFILHLIC